MDAMTQNGLFIHCARQADIRPYAIDTIDGGAWRLFTIGTVTDSVFKGYKAVGMGTNQECLSLFGPRHVTCVKTHLYRWCCDRLYYGGCT